MLRRAAVLLGLACATLLFGGANSDRYLQDVKHLSAPEMQGRGTGRKPANKAADYLVRELKRAGVRPLNGSYTQAFTVTTRAKLGDHNSASVLTGDVRTPWMLRQQWVPLNFSGNASVQASVVFAGYGITAPEYGYDDYATVDVTGKLVLVLLSEPQEQDANSLFAGRASTEHAMAFSKALNAKRHGARGMLLVSNRPRTAEADRLDRFYPFISPDDAGLPVAQIQASAASAWLQPSGSSLGSLVDDIDRDLRPHSFALPVHIQVSLQTDIRRHSRSVQNIVGYLPGLTQEYIILGAHYDHIGLGEQFSLAPAADGLVHPGADDNASGTAGLLELARQLASQPLRQRGVLFLAFTGEELGLLGSSYYVHHPLLPLADAVAMLNMDMIGRVQDDKLYVSGAGSARGLQGIVKQVAASQPLRVDISERADYGASDHMSFLSKQVPFLFFFSGLHPDYHRPSDTWEKINVHGAAAVLDLVAKTIERLQTAPRLPFLRHSSPGVLPSSQAAWLPSLH